MTRILINLPDWMIEKLNQVADDAEISRAAVIRVACSALLKLDWHEAAQEEKKK